MRDLLSWNISLGRWLGVHVRLHGFFVLLAALLLFRPYDDVFAHGALALGVLLLSVLAHEMGHCVAAWRHGGSVDQILLWPLGGLSHVHVSHDPHQELSTALAGPLVNLTICVVTFPLVAWLLGSWDRVAMLLNPFLTPWSNDGLTITVALEFVFWINWWLAMVNLLPAFPLDGGRALRALLWRHLGYRTAVLHVVRSATITSLGLIVIAWFISAAHVHAVVPLLLVAMLLYFSGRQEAQRLHEPVEDVAPAYEFAAGLPTLDALDESPEPEPGPIRRWLDHRREVRERRQQELEANEERRLDEVLERLQQFGMQGLSPEDQALLNRVSARYRNRQRG